VRGFNQNRLRQRRRQLPFAEQIRQPRRLRATFPFYNPRNGIRGRTYFVNGLDLDSSDIASLRQIISPRLKHALRTGITRGADVVINFIFKDNNIITSKSFNSFLIRNEQDFWNLLRMYNDLNTANNENYTHTIITIKIRIVAENAGGCANRKKKTRIGNTIHTREKTSNNNCFFAEVFTLLNLGVKRLSKQKGNEIRREFGLINDSLIPISTALDIYKRYRSDPNTDIAITDNSTRQTSKTGDNIVKHLELTEDHYSTVLLSEKQTCDKCGRVYFKTHDEKSCTLERQKFYEAKIKKTGKRFLLCGDKSEDSNNQDMVLHFDWETFQDKNIVEGELIHTPYIVGFHEDSVFKYLAGDSCVREFVDYLLKKGKELADEDAVLNQEDEIPVDEIPDEEDEGEPAKKKKKKRTLFANAFNGANFDHYFIFQEFLRRGLKPDKQIINNGSVISFQYKNIKLFDVCKHLQGGLSANLKALKCDVQKGDFNHDLATRWEDMTPELRESCLKYLKSDVMGLREIYNKLNTTIYDEYKVNLSSYISTSSLTFNMWKKSIRNKFSVELPNLEQEKAFRQSVRGGRTYKSKHKFVSEQYEAFHKGECSFDDIKDFVIDADVVSLYPTAMAHYPYPVGECKEFNPDQPIDAKELYAKQDKYFHLKDDGWVTFLINALVFQDDNFTNHDGLIIFIRSIFNKKWKVQTYKTDITNYVETHKPTGSNMDETHLKNIFQVYKTIFTNKIVSKNTVVISNGSNMGIYFIKYTTNKHLIHSIGGRRDEKTGALKWDLQDNTAGGWYTSIDIEDMITNGYKVEILKGYYWEEVDYIFKDYIETLFKKKEAEAKAGRKGSVIYMLTKLWMNGLYGKNIQRPIFNESRIIKSNTEYWKFWGTHIINDVTSVIGADNEIVWFVSGTPRQTKEKTECITKPTQLGAFILAYSRRIMVNFMKEANPQFDISNNPSLENQAKQIENDIYYTDTDSLQMHARNANLIKDLGKKSLGGITDDLGDNCKIIKGLWIAPKLYMLEYIKKGDPKPHFHFRGKGLNKNDLTEAQFEDMSGGKELKNTRRFQMKKLHIKKNSKQQAIPAFSIIHYSKELNERRLTRTVNSTAWDGRKFVGNTSVPHGYGI